MCEYIKQNGWYYLARRGDRVSMIGTTVAVAFDRQEGVMMKHGSPEAVNKWAIEQRRKIAPIIPEWADNLVVIEGEFEVEDLNKIINISGYIGRFYNRLYEKGSTIDVKA